MFKRIGDKWKESQRDKATRTRFLEDIKKELGRHIQNKSVSLDLKQFVCERDIKMIWTMPRIEALSAGLEWGKSRQVQLRVEKCFMKVLSILVYINWNEWADFEKLFLNDSGFGDEDLPYDPKFLSTSDRSLFQTIQYMFIPIVIEEGEAQPYEQRLILPFIASEHLGTGSYGVVKKTQIAPGQLRHEKRGRGTNDEPVWVACKVIPGSKADKLSGTLGPNQTPFTSEHRNLQYLKKCLTKNENVMLSIATFMHGTDFVIISDLADLDLHKFFHGNGLEGRTAQFTPLSLLKEASNLCGALEFIHEGLRLSSRTISCAHLDLHPSNILVTWLADIKNDPVGRWQLHDFGISRIKSSRDTEYDSHDQQDEQEARSGSAAALAPGELIKNHFSLTSSKRAPGAFMAPEIEFVEDKVVGQESDMWSFGCILAVLVAFVVGGPDNVIAFQRARLNDAVPSKARTDYFYKQGKKEAHVVKPSVEGYLLSLIKDEKKDKWITDVVELILLMLQVDTKKRHGITAKYVRDELENLCTAHRFSLLQAQDWMREPVTDHTDGSEATVTLSPRSKENTNFRPSLSRMNDSGVTMSRLTPSSRRSEGSGSAISSMPEDRPMSPPLGPRDKIHEFAAFEIFKKVRSSKIAISPDGTYFVYVHKNRAEIYGLYRDAEWKLSDKLALKSVKLQPFTYYAYPGAEFWQVSIAGSYVVLRSTKTPILYRLKCSHSDYNRWMLDNLAIYDHPETHSRIQDAHEITVSTRGDLLLRWDTSLCLCNDQRLRQLANFVTSRIISALFSQDGLWIYCWTKSDGNHKEYWYIWNALTFELVSKIPPRVSRPLESPGYGRNIIIPCSTFFVTSARTYHISSYGSDHERSTEELLSSKIRDVVAGLNFYNTTGTRSECLVLVKHSESPASDSLYTISLSDYSVSTTGVKLSSLFHPEKDGLAVTEEKGKVFAIVCHANGIIEKVQVAG